MGWEQNGFSHALHKEEHKKLSSAMSWACWPGVSTALCSWDSPFGLQDQRFSLFTDQTTLSLLEGKFGFMFTFLKILICACCQVRSSFGHRWGLVLRKSIDFWPMGGEVLVCIFCPGQDGALRSASCERAPWPSPICLEMLLSHISYETIFRLAVMIDNMLLGMS